MSRLIDEHPLIVLPGLASKIGLNESIVLQQVHYWLLQKRNAEDGFYWVYNSYKDWQKQFPFWSEKTIKRTITNLENQGFLISGNYNKMKMDKTKWYRIDYDKVNSLKAEDEEFNGKVKRKGQNDPSSWSESTNDEYNSTQAIPETTTKTTTKNTTSKNPSSKLRYGPEDDCYKLSELLYKMAKQNNEKFKEPNLQSWSNDFRLMMEIDKYTPLEIQDLIVFSQKDDFWKGNILSASKLRKQAITLTNRREQMMNRNKGNYQQNNQAPGSTYEDYDKFSI